MEKVDVLVIGGGTAGSNAARSAIKAGAQKVIMVHPKELNNTCVEEGCMPSKSILAGAHQGESLGAVEETRNAHITRLLKALTDSFAKEKFEIIYGKAKFVDSNTVAIDEGDQVTEYQAYKIVIATGSTPFIPPIKGLDTLGEKMLTSADVVSKAAHFNTVPKKVLTVGSGPIGLELSTFFHDMGAEVEVLDIGVPLRVFDPEFGEERVRASKDKNSFPIHTNSSLKEASLEGNKVLCTIEQDGKMREGLYDYVLIATGRRANIKDLALDNTDITLDERGNIVHNEYLETSHKGIFVAGDVLGHHQILHYASVMGRIAGHNTWHENEMRSIDYDKHMLAISFDQFPSALIGLTETEAKKRGIEVITATRHFNSIGLGILKRQEYGMWKLVADKSTGQIIGSQILGPDSAGELIQVLVPIIANHNTYGDIANMTWYHPTYAEIVSSMAKGMCKEDSSFCPGM